ncbi:ATP-binding cassette domain-containing protein [Microbacterium sp. 179-I 3D3 NHS]|uniref:ATP-binding cassette domain-containing protein n=1 Tax=Microbacterium sp. 179-I 3D3 NHS TaxID=3142382 RepID=UPI0039A1DF42
MLDRIDLLVGPRDRLAVVGDNGAGKSTLLDLLAGALTPAAGDSRISIPGGIAHAAQAPRVADEATVLDALDVFLADLRALEASIQRTYEELAEAGEAERPGVLEHLARLLEVFEARDGYDIDRRVDAAFDQLGLAGLDRARLFSSLSGGERARVALAAALSSHAELLLLDEPTNDLDARALSWLEGRIDAHRGALVVVSHDRALLARFARDIVHVENGGLQRYGDGYQGYLAARATERQRMAERHEAWKADVARNEALVAANAFRLESIPRKLELDGFGHGAFRARSRDHGAMGRIRMAKERVARLHAAPCPPPPEPLRLRVDLRADAPAVREEPLILLDRARMADPSLRVDALRVSAGDRWLVTGASGAGKTTLLRLLAQERRPRGGAVQSREGLRVSWLRQEVSPPGAGTVAEVFARRAGVHPWDAADVLSRFGLLAADDLDRDVRTLSVGQRRRLDLAVVLAEPGDVLMLDEPTNHLAPELVEQLESAIQAHPGAVVAVTHDRHWIMRARHRGATELRVEQGSAMVRP